MGSVEEGVKRSGVNNRKTKEEKKEWTGEA
jgi:hypothetical protein